MIYERPQEENLSESDAPNEPGLDEDSDASEEILRAGRSMTGMHGSAQEPRVCVLQPGTHLKTTL